MTNGRTDRQTDRRTFRLIESIGPEGRCFENHCRLISSIITQLLGNTHILAYKSISTLLLSVFKKVYESLPQEWSMIFFLSVPGLSGASVITQLLGNTHIQHINPKVFYFYKLKQVYKSLPI